MNTNQTVIDSGELLMVEPKPDHYVSIAERLREIDKQELAAITDQSPYENILFCATQSDLCWVLLDNGLPVAIGGVAASIEQSGLGVPWFLATTELEHSSKVRLWLATHSRELISRIHVRYSHLENYISADNKKTIAWLQWLGFKIGDPEPIGRNGEMLMRITREREQCAL